MAAAKASSVAQTFARRHTLNSDIPRPPAQQPLIHHAPPLDEPILQCVCGSNMFFVTKVDFICTGCFTSHKD